MMIDETVAVTSERSEPELGMNWSSRVCEHFRFISRKE